MGGKVLETEAKTIYRQGLQEGIQEGASENSRKTAIRLRSIGWTTTAIANLLDADEATVSKWLQDNY